MGHILGMKPSVRMQHFLTSGPQIGTVLGSSFMISQVTKMFPLPFHCDPMGASVLLSVWASLLFSSPHHLTSPLQVPLLSTICQTALLRCFWLFHFAMFPSHHSIVVIFSAWVSFLFSVWFSCTSWLGFVIQIWQIIDKSIKHQTHK